MNVARLAKCPPPTVPAEGSVLDAVRAMRQANMGAVAVLSNGDLVGVVTERDVTFGVVAEGRDPAQTPVRTVMSRKVLTVRPECRVDEAISLMVTNRIRHLVVTDPNGVILGLASARQVFEGQIAALDEQVRSLEAFIGGDAGLGG